jgi:chromosome segregation ATPase
MKKFARPLTILVTVLAVVYMAVAAVGTATFTDWKGVRKAQDEELRSQQAALADLDKRLADVDDKVRQAAEAAIAADEKALTDPATGREAELEKMLAQLEQRAHEVAQQIEVKARESNAKLDELKMRREDTVRLQGQHDELVSQKEAAEAEARRLRDLLHQARGVLERAQRRQRALESQVQGTN